MAAAYALVGSLNPLADPQFEVYDPDHAPIGLYGPRGLAMQNGFLHLDAPTGSLTGETNPTFTWSLYGADADTQNMKLYVSTHGPGDGLFPTDKTEQGRDLNPNRIVNGGDSTRISRNTDGQYQYTLDPNRALTQGQTYYWGVTIKSKDGRTSTRWGMFKTEPTPTKTGNFSEITVITHGFQIGVYSGDPALVHIPQQFIQMGQQISAAGGGGQVLLYNKADGTWVDETTRLPFDPGSAKVDKPLVLVLDWYKESDISDSGFSEAAADAFFASFEQLDKKLGGKLFASPWHFIGHSRGTVVNSEIIQRLGAYEPGIPSIQMTTLDPHDFNQPSLNVPLGLILNAAALLGPAARALTSIAKIGLGLPSVVSYGDFNDPDVKVWSNVTFADNYYQTAANQNASTFTPNGRSVTDTSGNPGAADLEINFTQQKRAGFITDDLSAFGISLFGVGGPHSRVWVWYGGTTDLSTSDFQRGGERLLRTLEDGESRGLILRNFPDFNGSNPFYTPTFVTGSPFAYGDTSAPWEGIGEGFFFDAFGGGASSRPTSAKSRAPLSLDNTETKKLTPGSETMTTAAVPSIFNGNFENGVDHLAERFPPLSGEIPGWAFHGGSDADVRNIVTLSGGNHALELSSSLSTITHNRMFVPQTANTIRIDARLEQTSPDDYIRIVLIPSNGAGMSELLVEKIYVRDLLSSTFLSRYFNVPASYRDSNAILSVDLVNPSGGSPTSKVLVDNIYFQPGLVITDDSAVANDAASFAAKDGDTATFTLSNPSASTIILVGAKLESNWFVDSVKLGGTVIANLNNDSNSNLIDTTGPISIGPGASIQLTVTSKVPTAFISHLNALASTEITDDQLFHAQLLLDSVFGSTGGSQQPATQTLDLFRLNDAADQNNDGTTLVFANTLVSKTRSLNLLNPGDASFEVVAGLDSFFSTGKIVNSDGTSDHAWVRFNPGFETTSNANLKILFHDQEIGRVALRATGVPKQTVGLSLDTLRTMLEAIRVDPVGNDPSGFARGAYNYFLSLFPSAITVSSNAWTQFKTGLDAAINSIYTTYIANGDISFEDTGLNPIVMVNRPADYAADANDNRARSYAGVDFAYTDFDTYFRDASGNLKTDLTLPAQRYLLSQMLNTTRSGSRWQGPMTLVVDGMVRQSNTKTPLPPTATDAQFSTARYALGIAFGWVIGHELSHNLGLLDEYDYTTFAKISPGPNTYMSTYNTLTTSDNEVWGVTLGLSDPNHTVGLENIDSVVRFFNSLDKYDRDYNRPTRTNQSIGLAPAGPGSGGSPAPTRITGPTPIAASFSQSSPDDHISLEAADSSHVSEPVAGNAVQARAATKPVTSPPAPSLTPIAFGQAVNVSITPAGRPWVGDVAGLSTVTTTKPSRQTRVSHPICLPRMTTLGDPALHNSTSQTPGTHSRLSRPRRQPIPIHLSNATVRLASHHTTMHVSLDGFDQHVKPVRGVLSDPELTHELAASLAIDSAQAKQGSHPSGTRTDQALPANNHAPADARKLRTTAGRKLWTGR